MNAWILSTLAFCIAPHQQPPPVWTFSFDHQVAISDEPAASPHSEPVETAAQPEPQPTEEEVSLMAGWLAHPEKMPPEQLVSRPVPYLLATLASALPWKTAVPEPKGKITLPSNYYLYQLPEGYTPDKAWPLIISFHGTPKHHCERVHNVYWKGDPGRRGYILVSPNLEKGQWHRFGDPLVDELIWDVLTRFRVDTDHIYTDGYSSGGTGSWIYGTKLADLMAGAVIRCGVRRIPDSQIANLKGRGVYLIHATSDTKVKVQFARGAVDVMKRMGIKHIYVEYPGEHDFFPKANDKVLDFFDSLRNPGSASFEYFGTFWSLDRIVHFFHLRGKQHQVKGGYANNRVWLQIEGIDKATSLEVFLSPEMVDFSRPIEIVLNGTSRTVVASPTSTAFFEAFRLLPRFDPASPDRTFVAGVRLVVDGKVLEQPEVF